MKQVEIKNDPDVSGYIDFSVWFSNPPLNANAFVYIFLDTDRNAKTGAQFNDATRSGADYWLFLKAGTGTARLYRTAGLASNGSYNGTLIPNAVLGSTLGFNSWGVELNRASIANVTSFNFWVDTSTDGASSEEDAPARSTYIYPAA
jgi:hypothetical protein